MRSVEEAYRDVVGRAYPLPPQRVPLAEALGRILAESVASDRDSPPFDKAIVDGFAVRAADCPGPGPWRLRIVEEITAGRTPSRPLEPGDAAAIMTGAPLPTGADSVVMVEKVAFDGPIVLVPGPVRPGEGRMRRGREMEASQVIAEPRDRLGPARLGVLASVGRTEVLAIPSPRVAIVPTGDELAKMGEMPGPGQIRESNGTILAALTRSVGAEPRVFPAAPDHLDTLIDRLSSALAGSDVLIVCGGVSAGSHDLVPEALERLGVERVFHKVRLKPGKPLLFGVATAREDAPPTLVFGLPGNPVSGIVGFLLFVAPALAKLAGKAIPGTPSFPVVRLAAPFRHRGDRPTFHPARRADRDDGTDWFEPLPWSGSSDLLSVSRADGFLGFPAGDHDHDPGERVPFLPMPIS